MIPPGSVIGILGGGQLGRLFALAARDMGYRIHVLDPDPHCATAPVADRVVTAPFTDAVAAEYLASSCAVVTLEIERIGKEALEAARRRCPTRPGPHVLALAQDRRVEKQWLNDNGFPTAPWRAATTADEVTEAVRTLGGAVVKSAREGYDGKGQARAADHSKAAAAFTAIGHAPAVVEAWLPLKRELSVIVARRPSGEVKCFPPALNHHEHHILDWSVMPGPLEPELAERATNTARAIADAMQLEGLLAIEFFELADGRLLVNEMAPRPHNSGHPATEACLTSQFEQLVRAVCDLPLGSVDSPRPAAIANLLGDLWKNGPPRFDDALAIEGVRLHLYGKSDARPGRKMGHLAATGATTDEAVARVIEARRRLGGASPGGT